MTLWGYDELINQLTVMLFKVTIKLFTLLDLSIDHVSATLI